MAANTRPNKLDSLRLIIDRRLSAGALETVDFHAGAESARVRNVQHPPAVALAHHQIEVEAQKTRMITPDGCRALFRPIRRNVRIIFKPGPTPLRFGDRDNVPYQFRRGADADAFLDDHRVEI